MSRSTRKPYIKDGWKGSVRKQFYKRYSNRIIRRTVNDIADGNAYRKVFESWSICDFRWRYDPRPYICWHNGVPRVIEPEPEYKVRRK